MRQCNKNIPHICNIEYWVNNYYTFREEEAHLETGFVQKLVTISSLNSSQQYTLENMQWCNLAFDLE
jgi:hypothetical protein